MREMKGGSGDEACEKKGSGLVLWEDVLRPSVTGNIIASTVVADIRRMDEMATLG